MVSETENQNEESKEEQAEEAKDHDLGSKEEEAHAKEGE